MMNPSTSSLFCAVAMTVLQCGSAGAVSCGGKPSATINGKAVWKADGAVGFKTARLTVDADGAPNSYQVDGNGLSYTCDGVTIHGSIKCQKAWAAAKKSGDYSELHIFGFQVGAHNVPLIQGPGDPLPGVGYISTTSVPVSDGPVGTQRHWVDATKIPYVVLSGRFIGAYNVRPGDVAVVYRPRTGKSAFGVYGDGGRLGEASVKLHQEIGNDPIVTTGGTKRARRGIEDATLTVVFPGSKTHPVVDAAKWQAEINRIGDTALADWGGIDRLKACAK